MSDLVIEDTVYCNYYYYYEQADNCKQLSSVERPKTILDDNACGRKCVHRLARTLISDGRDSEDRTT